MARLTPEQREEIRIAKANLNRDAAENWGDPQWQRETAAAIQLQIQEGFMHENLLELMTTVETAADGDRITVDEVWNVDVHWVAPGGRIEESTWNEEVFELRPDRVGFHLTEMSEKMRSNFADRQARMVAGAITALDAGINSRLVAVFRAATPSTGSSYIGASGLSLATVNGAITSVRDASLANEVTIVGRGTMVDQLLNQLQANNNFAPAAQDEIVANGFLGRYRGANVVKLINYRDNHDNSYFAQNELYVIGTDASLVGLWGNLEAAAYEDPGVNNAKYHFEGLRKAGFVVYRPDRIRRIVDTSQPA